MAPKRARSNLRGRGDRFGDFSDANRKVLVRADAGRKRLIKKYKQKGEIVPGACYRREVEEFEREVERRRLAAKSSAAASRLDLLERTVDLLQPYALDLLESLPVEMAGGVISLVRLRDEKKKAEQRLARDED